MSLKLRTRNGYVFMLSVLFIGSMAIMTATTLVMLGLAAERNGFTFTQSAQAFHNAQTCIERALLSLRADANYVGNETLTLSNGTCTLQTIGGSGNSNRTICASGTFANTTRRIEADVLQLLPAGKITSWQEVSSFSLCDS